MPTNDVKLVLFYTDGPKPTCVGETGGGNSSRRPMDDKYICTSVRTGGRPKNRRIRTRKSTCCVQYAIVANILRQKPSGSPEAALSSDINRLVITRGLLYNVRGQFPKSAVGLFERTQ